LCEKTPCFHQRESLGFFKDNHHFLLRHPLPLFCVGILSDRRWESPFRSSCPAYVPESRLKSKGELLPFQIRASESLIPPALLELIPAKKLFLESLGEGFPRNIRGNNFLFSADSQTLCFSALFPQSPCE
jgi:hypothetical protein